MDLTKASDLSFAEEFDNWHLGHWDLREGPPSLESYESGRVLAVAT